MFKINEKCFKKRKKGETTKTKTKERRILLIVDCNETKTDNSIKKFVSLEKMSQGQLWYNLRSWLKLFVVFRRYF